MNIRAKNVMTSSAVIILLAAVAVILVAIPNNPKPVHHGRPCTGQWACIRLTDQNGAEYELNDFRFLPNHCILIRQLPDSTTRRICGDWHMDWIGPQTTPHRVSA